MANTANITKLNDGMRNAVFHVFIQGDGVTGDMNDLVIVDPSKDLDPILGKRPCLTITELWYSFSGFDAKLEFAYLTDDNGVWSLAPGNGNHLCFDSFGGIKDRSNPLDGTGKLMLTTIGLLSASSCGTLIIKVRKD